MGEFPLSSGMRSERNIGLSLSATVTVPTNHTSPQWKKRSGFVPRCSQPVMGARRLLGPLQKRVSRQQVKNAAFDRQNFHMFEGSSLPRLRRLQRLHPKHYIYCRNRIRLFSRHALKKRVALHIFFLHLFFFLFFWWRLHENSSSGSARCSLLLMLLRSALLLKRGRRRWCEKL